MRLKRAAAFDIVPLAPFDFGLTMKKPSGWSLFNAGEVYEDKTFWTATRLGGRLLGLRFRSVGSLERPRVSTTVFAASPIPGPEKAQIKGSLEKLTGADQDLTPFYRMAMKDEVLSHTVRHLYGMHDTQEAYLFNSVVLSICLQMAKMDRSMKMMAAINERHGTRVSFDGKEIVVEPSAEAIARLRPKAFAKECNLGYRAKFLVGAAKAVSRGFPDTMEIMEMSPEGAKEKLMELPGVGDYAADIINPNGGFPIDAWSVDIFGKLFFGEEPEDGRGAIEAVKQEGLRRWGSFAWLAFFYVAQDLKRLSESLGVQLRLQ